MAFPTIPQRTAIQPPPHAAVPAKRKHRKWPWVIVAVVVLLVTIGVTNGASKTPTTSAAVNAAAAAAAQQSAPAVVPAAPVAPAAPAAPSLSDAIVAWRDGGGLDRITSLGTDFGAIGTAGQNQDLQAVQAACSTLQSDVESAQGYAQLPDPEAQTAWSAGLAQAARAATDCVAATVTNNADLLGRAASEIDKATDYVGAAAARIKVIAAGN